MKLRTVLGAITLSSFLTLVGCMDVTYEDGEKAAYQEEDYAKAKEIWVSLANNSGNDRAMYSLYELYRKRPDIVSYEEAYAWLQRAADAGRPDAEYEYGLFLIEHGRFELAYNYIDKAAVWKEERAINYLEHYDKIREIRLKSEEGDPEAMYKYAAWLLTQNEEKLKEEGTDWVRKSAMAGNANGQALYGTLFFEKKDYNVARTWFDKAVLQGNDVADYYLGIMKIQGLSGTRRVAQGLDHLKKAADKGNTLACFELGRMYLNGDKNANIQENLPEAVEYIGKAASENMIEAQYLLATLYENGIGVKVDYRRAMELYRLAASHDHIGAESKLGQLYLTKGDSTQTEEGIQWLNKAIVEGDDAEAKTFLAYAYSQGIGVKKNYDKAYYWYREAADVDVAIAQFNLGVMIANGRADGGPDIIKATYWIEQAAYNDFKDAILAYAMLFEKGFGVEKDEKRARFWLDRIKGYDTPAKRQSISNLLNFDYFSKLYRKK